MKTIKVKPLHKIIERAELQDGTHIQIEDWHPCYDFEPTCGTLAAYPIAKRTNKRNSPFGAVWGQTFRLAFNFKSEAQTRQAFEQLVNGIKTLKDFAKYAEPNSDIECI